MFSSLGYLFVLNSINAQDKKKCVQHKICYGFLKLVVYPLNCLFVL